MIEQQLTRIHKRVAASVGEMSLCLVRRSITLSMINTWSSQLRQAVKELEIIAKGVRDDHRKN